MGSTGPVERKVTWATTAATALTTLVFIANHATEIPGYSDAPLLVKAAVSVLVIAGGTFGAGYRAPHTRRSDPDARRSEILDLADRDARDARKAGPPPGAEERLVRRRDDPGGGTIT